MRKILLTIVPISLLSITPQTHAEVSLDGTLGRSGALQGPEYLIQADFGKQHGGNLFHSFQEFNLQSHESATFSGPNHIQNVISRVTGGNPSNIDGLIRSTIFNADMYFLNPYGIMFGPNARLDVQGSFHASTADYLRLEDGGRFDARYPSNSLLTVAPIEAFGFLNTPIAPISVQGRGKITQADWEENPTGLIVPLGKTLSLIGGDIKMWMGTFFKTETFEDEGIIERFETEPFEDKDIVEGFDKRNEYTYLNSLYAPGGRINLISIAGTGEAIPENDGFVVPTSRGDITMQNLHIGTSDKISGGTSDKSGGGTIYIRGKHVEIINSTVKNNTLGKNSGVIDIQADHLELRGTEGQSNISANTMGVGLGGTINIEARQITLNDGAMIRSGTGGSGKGGNISIKVADTLKISDQYISGEPSGIFAMVANPESDAGNAGNINIEARQISLQNGGIISNLTIGSGNSGTITIVADTLTIAGGFKIPWQQLKKYGLEWVSSMISAATMGGSGKAGKVKLTARQIVFKEGGGIHFGTAGSGEGGSLEIVTDSLIAKGEYVSEVNTIGSGITGNSLSEESDAGNAGYISLDANSIILTDLAEISADGINANGGTIELDAQQIVINNGAIIQSRTLGSGTGGNISIKVTDALSISGQHASGHPSYISASTISSEEEAGTAGHIDIEAPQILLTEGGVIYSLTKGSGNAGIITIVTDTLRITDGFKVPWSELENIGGRSPSTISVGTLGGTGKGGTIDLTARQIVLKGGGQINFSTVGEGDGGSVNIITDNFIATGKYLGEKPVFNDEKIIFGSGITGASLSIQPNAGKAGHISLHAKSINLTNQAQISTDGTNADGGTIGIEAQQIVLNEGARIRSRTFGSGAGGNILIEVADTLSVSGQDISGDSSGIFAESIGKTDNAGNAGNIRLKVGQLILTGQAEMNAGTYGSGQGGNIDIEAQTIKNSGSILIAKSEGQGNAGKITVRFTEKLQMQDGVITAATEKSTGGNIEIISEGYFYLINSDITTKDEGKNGNGGNIILKPKFVVLDNSPIIAQANGADGGNIDIDTTAIYRFSESLIYGSGHVTINVADIKIDDSLLALSTDFLDVSNQLQHPCSSRMAENLNRFWLKPSEGTANAVNDLLPSGPLLSQIKGIKQVGYYPKETKIQQYLTLTGCRPKVAMKSPFLSNEKNQVIPDDLLF